VGVKVLALSRVEELRRFRPASTNPDERARHSDSRRSVRIAEKRREETGEEGENTWPRSLGGSIDIIAGSRDIEDRAAFLRAVRFSARRSPITSAVNLSANVRASQAASAVSISVISSLLLPPPAPLSLSRKIAKDRSIVYLGATRTHSAR